MNLWWTYFSFYLKLTITNFFWLTLPASVVLQRGGLSFTGAERCPPSHPLMMFDFLCCAHEAVPPTSPYLPSSISAAVSVLWSCSCSLTSSHCSHFPSEGGKKILQTLLICSHTPSPLSSAELLVLHSQERLLWNAAETAPTAPGENFWAVAGTGGEILCGLLWASPSSAFHGAPSLLSSAAGVCAPAPRGKEETKALVLCDNIWYHIVQLRWLHREIPRVLCCQKS